MESVVIFLSIAALISGVIAAIFWWKASKVMVMPMYHNGDELVPLPVETNGPEWLRAVYFGIDKSGKLNKTAAIWTAVSVALGATSSIVSALGPASCS